MRDPGSWDGHWVRLTQVSKPEVRCHVLHKRLRRKKKVRQVSRVQKAKGLDHSQLGHISSVTPKLKFSLVPGADESQDKLWISLTAKCRNDI